MDAFKNAFSKNEKRIGICNLVPRKLAHECNAETTGVRFGLIGCDPWKHIAFGIHTYTQSCLFGNETGSKNGCGGNSHKTATNKLLGFGVDWLCATLGNTSVWNSHIHPSMCFRKRKRNQYLVWRKIAQKSDKQTTGVRLGLIGSDSWKHIVL